MDPRWSVRFNYAGGKGETSNVVGDFRLGTQRRSFCCSSQQSPRSVDTSLSVCASGLTWDRVGASQAVCFRLCRAAAHHLKGPNGMVSILAPPAGGRATFALPAGLVSPPGWLLAAPHAVTGPGCARSKQGGGGRPHGRSSGHLIGVLLLWLQALKRCSTLGCIYFVARWKPSLQDAGGRTGAPAPIP